ncbi:MAG TPA: DsrE family protein, partial [Dehalococcoidia bacterium]|nr:DsrE family protein [Dehalococcoidia bacterium]
MKIGIVIYSNDSETAWNAFRFGNFVVKEGDKVKVFLLGKGVECESLDTDKFKVTEQMQTLVDNGGEIFACGTCL